MTLEQLINGECCPITGLNFKTEKVGKIDINPPGYYQLFISNQRNKLVMSDPIQERYYKKWFVENKGTERLQRVEKVKTKR